MEERQETMKDMRWSIHPLALGEAWIELILERDFQRLEEICQPEVVTRLMTPGRVATLDNASMLIQHMQQWFGEIEDIRKEQARVALLGEKLSVAFRLSGIENGEGFLVEQQLFCALRDGRINQVSLLCSGFQPLLVSKPPVHVDALLEFHSLSGQGSTCALLTPAIKCKLAEMTSGQVLEIHVDDPTARGDIEAWSRLTGNAILMVEQGTGRETHYFVKKK